jgi:hypothetical protein
MAASDWMEIYRAYDGAELATEIAELRAEVKGSYMSQSSGSTSAQRSLSELRDRLQAATRVQSERSGRLGSGTQHGQVDFSGCSMGDF